MRKIIMCKGLPASGKSTRAKQMVKDNPGKYKRINKDELRIMLDEGHWSKANEKYVIQVRDAIIHSALEHEKTVIVDDTNFFPEHEIRLIELATKHKAEFEIKLFDTGVQECINRDSKRDKPVGKQVILKMREQYLKPEPVEYDEELPHCIICDIDGTLAQKGDRDIYDTSKVYLDTIIKPVRDIVNQYKGSVIIVSGREDIYKEVTLERLENNGVLFSELHMRKGGDTRNDSIIKKEIYDEFIKGKYNVDYVLEDRKRVKRMRVQEGLFVFDVNQFDLEF